MEATVECTIINKYGFHARPSTSFSALASSFQSNIIVSANGSEVDGKSIMGLMSLGAPSGAKITITANGKDAQQAADALREHVDSRFGGIE